MSRIKVYIRQRTGQHIKKDNGRKGQCTGHEMEAQGWSGGCRYVCVDTCCWSTQVYYFHVIYCSGGGVARMVMAVPCYVSVAVDGKEGMSVLPSSIALPDRYLSFKRSVS